MPWCGGLPELFVMNYHLDPRAQCVVSEIGRSLKGLQLA